MVRRRGSRGSWRRPGSDTMGDVTAATTSSQDAPRAVTFSCGHCGASLTFDGVRTTTCPYCASPNFVERPPQADRPTAQFVLTFIGDAAVARRWLASWLPARSLCAAPRLQ